MNEQTNETNAMQICEKVTQKEYVIESNERDSVKVWGAEITGKDAKWGLARKFCSQKMLSSTSSKHRYFDYTMTVEEGKIYEWRVSGAYKNRGGFVTLENGEIKSLSAEEVRARVK